MTTDRQPREAERIPAMRERQKEMSADHGEGDGAGALERSNRRWVHGASLYRRTHHRPLTASFQPIFLPSA